MSPMRMDRLEAGIRIAAELVEAINRRDLGAVEALLAEDFVLEPSQSRENQDKPGFLAGLGRRFSERPGARLAVEELVGMGPRCLLRWACDRGGAENSPGRERGMVMLRTRDGLVTEALAYRKEAPQ